jgi:hypothetical protein
MPQVERMIQSSLSALFPQATALEALTISMPLPTQLFNALTQGFQHMQHLHSLSLCGSGLSDARCSKLCVALSDCRALKSLDLAGCSISDNGATAVAALVKHRANKCVPNSAFFAFLSSPAPKIHSDELRGSSSIYLAGCRASVCHRRVFFIEFDVHRCASIASCPHALHWQALPCHLCPSMACRVA